MKRVQASCAFIGRFLLGVGFLLPAVKKILNWQETEQNLVSMLSDWQSYLGNFPLLQQFFFDSLSYATFILITMTALEFLGAILLILGLRVRFGAFSLLLFFLPITALFHPFWFFDGTHKETEMALFLKNFTMAGGLFYVLAFGLGKATGEKSVEPPKK